MLLVVIVPRLVQKKYVSTVLGAHQSVSCTQSYRSRSHDDNLLTQLEHTGAVISLTVAGLILDKESADPLSGHKRYQLLLRTFLVANVFQLGGVLLLWYLTRQRDLSARQWGSLRHIPGEAYTVKATDNDDDDLNGAEDTILLEELRSGSPDANGAALSPSTGMGNSEPFRAGTAESSTRKRGLYFGVACALLIAAAWILFIVTAWLRLRSKSERVSGASSRE